MCGIAGILTTDRGLAHAAPVAMASAMQHRGPDTQGGHVAELRPGSGTWVGLCHRRLSILDLSPLGHQPMVHPTTGDVLVFNGEIYNFAAIRGRLETAGSVFQGHSDTEVLLHALSRDGPRCLRELEGMYALAFVESRTGRVLLARDPLGIKPLYVGSGRDGSLLFASEVRALLASGVVDAGVDPAGLAGLLAYGAVQEPRTFFASIRVFPAGCSQWLEPGTDGRAITRGHDRFWAPPRVDGRVTMDQAIERVRATLDQAVRDHLVADVPVGIFFSSGMDSTIVAGLARRHRDDVRTFTVGFADNPDLTETTLSAETARLMGLRHRSLSISGGDALEATRAWLGALDQPSVDGLNTFVIAQAVRNAGIVVALSGLGGDELFGGYSSFVDVPAIHRRLRSLAWMPPAWRAALFAARGLTRPATVRAKLREMGGIGPDILRLYLHRRRLMSDRRLATLGIDAEALGLDRSALERAELDAFAPSGDPVADVARYEAHFYMGNMLLRDSDANGMAHSIEIRVPLLDRRVADLALSLPGAIICPDGGATKHLLRAAFPEFLRPALLQQGKRGFTLPIRRWMTGPLRPLCEDALAALRDHRLLREQAINAIWREFNAQPEHPVWSSAFMLCVLGTYLRNIPGRAATVRHAASNLPLADSREATPGSSGVAIHRR